MSALPRSANYRHRFTLARSKFPHLLLLPAQAGDSMVLDASLDYLACASVVARSLCVLSCGGAVPRHSDAHWSHPN
jgi:hypothetical protein